MTMQSTGGIWMPREPSGMIAVPIAFTSTLIDASTELVAQSGQVWTPDRGSKNITKVGFRFGTVTKAGGSALTVSLRDVSLTAGATIQPDSTPDQTVAIANADSGFVSNTFYVTGALSGTRTVAHGDLLSVVIGYDGSGRLGSDAVNITGLSTAGGQKALADGVALFSGSWPTTGSNQAVNCLLEFDDGSFGCLGNWPVVGASGSTTFNTGSTPDELALAFTVPFKCKIDGMYWVMQQNASNVPNFSLNLYDGTTLMISKAFDANAIEQNNAAKMYIATIAEQTLTPGTQYYLSLLPTTSTSIIGYYYEVNSNSHFQANPPGTSWVYSDRTNAGSWSASTTTRRPWAGIRISALDDGTPPPTFVMGLGL